MSTLNDRRIAEYQTYISKFINDIQGVDPTGIPEPHIPVFGETYEKCKYKMVFCGMETYGWGGTFHSATGGTFESDMVGTFKVLQSIKGQPCTFGRPFSILVGLITRES